MTKETIADTATKVAEKTMSEAGAQIVTTANDILSATSKAFPELAGKSFEFYAHYVFANGVADIVVGAFSLCIFVLAAILSRRLWLWVAKNAENNDLDGDSVAFIVIAVATLLIVLTTSMIEGIGAFKTGTIKVVAPEGAVINEIISNLNNNTCK